MELKFGTYLKYGSYRIESVLGQGGFGITYLAEQVGLNRQVAIKEFFMKEYCNRDETTSQISVPSAGSKDLVNRFKAKFIKEAQTIAKLNHPNIMRIYDIFEENGTAYYVMEYHGKGSLSELLKSKGKLPESEALRYIRQVADALSYIHENKMNHLDVKPGNVLLDSKGNAVLIDFGMSKRYDEAGNQTSTTPVGISHGYAPMEQYKKGGVSAFSPATDIYSLGATLYKLITGETPPEADEVNEEGLPELSATISKSVRVAIESAMQPKRKDRPQSIAEFLQLLEEEAETEFETKAEAEESAESEATTFAAQEKETPKKRGWLYVAIACVIAAVLAIFVVSVIQKRTEADERAQNDSLEYSTLIASADSLSQKGDKTSLERSKEKYVAASKYEEEYGKGRYSDMFSKNASKSATELQNRIDSLVAAEEAAAKKAEEERLARLRAEKEGKERETTSINYDAELYEVVDPEGEAFVVVEEMPSFPGGESAMQAFIRKNLKYPQIALENGISGRVICTFVIDGKGKITGAEVIRSVDPNLDREALRVINMMPDWKPGKHKGKPVRVRYTLPVVFRLNEM